jgi:hypothetical protein
MTSPRQRKKRAAFLAKQKTAEMVETKPVVAAPVVVKQPEQVVATPAPPVVVSEPVAAETSAPKPKKLAKNGLVEIKEKAKTSVDQVVEQTKAEVKTETKE